MNETIKTILLGSIITLGVLGISVFGLYKIYSSDKTSSKNNDIKEENAMESTINIFKENYENENIKTNSTKKVTIYMFKGEGCPHCTEAVEYFENLKDKNENIEVIAYEVWYNDNNRKLMNKLEEKIDKDIRGVPFFVIGDYTSSGFGDGDKLIKKAEEMLNSDNYQDIVLPLINDIDTQLESEIITSE